MDAGPVHHDVFVVTSFGAAFQTKTQPHPQTDAFRTWDAAAVHFRKRMLRLPSRGFCVDVKRRADGETFALAMDTAQETGVVLTRVRVNARCRRRDNEVSDDDGDT
jgi:hypothetical protein